MIVKFPYSMSRRAFARKPRRSINGTPEERAAKAAGSSAIVTEFPSRSTEKPNVVTLMRRAVQS